MNETETGWAQAHGLALELGVPSWISGYGRGEQVGGIGNGRADVYDKVKPGAAEDAEASG